MKITVKPVKGRDFEVDIDADMEVEALKGLIIAEHYQDYEPDHLYMVYKMKMLEDHRETLQTLGVKDGDIMGLWAYKDKLPEIARQREDAVQVVAKQPSWMSSYRKSVSGWAEELLGDELETRSGLQSAQQALGFDAKVVLIYTSADWSKPCKEFTRKLAQAYPRQSDCQVILNSHDSAESPMRKHYNTMPWLAFPFNSRRRDLLDRKFGSLTMPSVLALDRITGRVLDKSAADTITECEFDLDQCCVRWCIREASSQAPPHRENEVEAALCRVDLLAPDVRDGFYKALAKIVTNLIDHPGDKKFRKRNLQEKVFSVGDGAAEIALRAVGFELQGDMLTLPGPPDEGVNELRDALERHVKQHG